MFRAFEGAHRAVQLATAVRLNASFPYVSPAISLPVWPERRPVDAGYYDNFGVDLATAWLDDRDVSRWITANCAGVAVIQVRAFPSEVPTPPASALARAKQFITSPPEGLFNACKASQMFRNDQQLVATARRYNQGREFLKVFTFEANTDVSMSWYQRCDEMRALEGLLRPPVVQDLRELYGRPGLLGDRPPDAEVGTALIARAAVQWVNGRWDPALWQLPEDDPLFAASWDRLMAALQRGDPTARRSQYLHHRAKVARELGKVEQFWSRPGEAGAE